jgi:hypothetical protein
LLSKILEGWSNWERKIDVIYIKVQYATPYQMLDISRKAAEQICLVSVASLILFAIRRVCWIVEWLWRKPDWWSGSISSFSTMGISLWKRSFSKTFERMGRRLIGR